jgi:transcription antitermination factor NusG
MFSKVWKEMDLELTGRSCIRSTMTQWIRVDSDPICLAEKNVPTETLWYAGYTASRHEKRVAEHFAQRGVEHFLPLYETIHRWNNGRHRVQLPLFPGYIFVRIALRDRLRVIEVPGFVRLVGFNNLPYPLPEADINRMKDALSKGVLAEPYPYLTAGTRVEIRNGPLQGMTGILLRRQNRCRVVVSVDLIMRSMIVEVEAGDVVPVRRSAFNIGQIALGGKTTDQQAQL